MGPGLIVWARANANRKYIGIVAFMHLFLIFVQARNEDLGAFFCSSMCSPRRAGNEPKCFDIIGDGSSYFLTRETHSKARVFSGLAWK